MANRRLSKANCVGGFGKTVLIYQRQKCLQLRKVHMHASHKVMRIMICIHYKRSCILLANPFLLPRILRTFVLDFHERAAILRFLAKRGSYMLMDGERNRANSWCLNGKTGVQHALVRVSFSQCLCGGYRD